MPGFAPLRGIHVADFSKVLAGPLCTQHLADLGATVVKVEPCEIGDDTRAWPPHAGGSGAVFLSANRNKQSVAIDLKSAVGQEVARRLVARSDVLVESFRKGVMDRLGFGYEAARQMRPGLIYASISGFGQTGPLSELPGYDVMIQAFSGLMSITGEKGGTPVRSAFSPLDQTTGLWAAFGILAALRERDATGEGRYIDASLFETGLSFLGYTAQIYWLNGKVPERSGSGHESLCPYQAFQAADGFLLLAVGNDKLWSKFCAAAGLHELADDPRYRTNADRVARFAETVRLVGDKLAERRVCEWVSILTAAGVPNSPINTVDHVLALQQTHERGMVMSYEHPLQQGLKTVAMPLVFEGGDREVRTAPPLLGQHTAQVMAELGFSQQDIRQHEQQGAIRLASDVV